MDKSGHEGFNTVEEDLEELDRKIRKHRIGILKRILIVIGILAVVIIAAGLFAALRTYSDYDVKTSYDLNDSDADVFVDYKNGMIKYSNDGISSISRTGELRWNQAFEMNSPKISVCEEYVAAYDKGGMDIFILNESGLKKKLEMSMPIETVCVARQGTVAVLMKEDDVSYLKLYDKSGKELASGEYFIDKGGIPIDIALSYNAKKLAVDTVDVTDGKIKSEILFYNFGSVGQNEINNNVGDFLYSDVLVTDVEYVSDNRMIAVCDQEIIVYDGAEKPTVSKEIFTSEDVKSVFYNASYIGVITGSSAAECTYNIKVYDMRGKTMMNVDTAMSYEKASFLSNNEICLTNDFDCELYSVHGIKKFTYTFDSKIQKIIPTDSNAGYLFVFDGKIQDVRLK